MKKKERLKILLRDAIIRLNNRQYTYNFLVAEREDHNITHNKRITNKYMIRRLKELNNKIKHIEENIEFLKN
jgi:hypothetical protein